MCLVTAKERTNKITLTYVPPSTPAGNAVDASLPFIIAAEAATLPRVRDLASARISGLTPTIEDILPVCSLSPA